MIKLAAGAVVLFLVMERLRGIESALDRLCNSQVPPVRSVAYGDEWRWAPTPGSSWPSGGVDSRPSRIYGNVISGPTQR